MKQQNNTQPKRKMALDDESRIKILSPGRLVVKRFFRNKLAIAGLIIVLAMYAFAFIGGMITPYDETQAFYTSEMRSKNYANATINTKLYYHNPEGEKFTSTAQAAFVLARNNGETQFEQGGDKYTWIEMGDEFFRIQRFDEIATAMERGGKILVAAAEGKEIDQKLNDALVEAVESGAASLTYDGTEYEVVNNGKIVTVRAAVDVAFASLDIFNSYTRGDEAGYDFMLAALVAMEKNANSFEVGDEKYTIEAGVDDMTIAKADGTPYMSVSNLIVTPASTDVFLDVPFKEHVYEAIDQNVRNAEFEYTDAETGETAKFIVERKDFEFYIRTETETELIALYTAPNAEHWLGTDGNGMDIMTRLMYGGRVSLMIGIIVVLLEVFIGVVIGGVSGYFGGWVDQICMRLVDTINCIPTMPLYIILGAMMDTMRVDSSTRIYYLILIFGLLGWVGIARVTRGQILSLREQEFMTATEATGLSVSRRIFRHLIPNVVPQLVVFASMGLGSIILSEATLSFLGLGVKFPYASWGNIVNAVNDSFVLTNYWFVWIPAGFLILITVLGYNFVGDGLRDAFDPKMKR